jgi:hypothetical protein
MPSLDDFLKAGTWMTCSESEKRRVQSPTPIRNAFARCYTSGRTHKRSVTFFPNLSLIPNDERLSVIAHALQVDVASSPCLRLLLGIPFSV